MTNQPTTFPRQPLRSGGLSNEQRSLVETMRKHQFGWIENMVIRDGQPVIDPNLRVVRVARMSGENAGTRPGADDFELKGAFVELFEELSRLGTGIVLKLEFRHGSPFQIQLETSVGSK